MTEENGSIQENVESKESMEKSEFERFTSQAMRGPRHNVTTQLLAALLIKANNTSDDLKKIRYICEAAYLCKNQNKLDMKLIENCKTLAIALSTVQGKKSEHGLAIPWPFTGTEENFKRYFEPWQKVYLSYYPWYVPLRTRQFPDSRFVDPANVSYEDVPQVKQIINEVVEAVNELAKWKRFFEQTFALRPEGYDRLTVEFENWALPQLIPLLRVIAEEVDPQIYSEVFKSMFRDKEEKEAENASSLD